MAPDTARAATIKARIAVALGGAVSVGCSSNVPAATEPMSADGVPANKNKSNFHVPSFSERPSDLAGGVAVIADDFGCNSCDPSMELSGNVQAGSEMC